MLDFDAGSHAVHFQIDPICPPPMFSLSLSSSLDHFTCHLSVGEESEVSKGARRRESSAPPRMQSESATQGSVGLGGCPRASLLPSIFYQYINGPRAGRHTNS